MRVAVLGALAIYGLSRWPVKPLNVYFLFQAILVVTLVFSALEAAQSVIGSYTLAYIASDISRDDLIAERLGPYHDAMARLATLPAETTVRFVWEPRGYYCPANISCIADLLLDYWRGPLEAGSTPEAILADWERTGTNYILVSNTVKKYFSENAGYAAINAQFETVVTKSLTAVWSSSDYTLYRWKFF